jgi:hypothetical protein
MHREAANRKVIQGRTPWPVVGDDGDRVCVGLTPSFTVLITVGASFESSSIHIKVQQQSNVGWMITDAT